MGVEICTRCDTHIDLDYDTSGHFFEHENKKPYRYEYEYVCGLCLTDKELVKLEGKNVL